VKAGQPRLPHPRQGQAPERLGTGVPQRPDGLGQVECPGASVQPDPPPIIEAVGQIAALLDLQQQQPRAQGMDRPSRSVEDLVCVDHLALQT